MSADGKAHGITSIGAVTEEEFITTFGRRWSTAARPVEITAVREEVYLAIRPGMIADIPVEQARYQRSSWRWNRRRRDIAATGSSQHCPLHRRTGAMPVLL